MLSRLFGILVAVALLGGGGYAGFRLFIQSSEAKETVIPTSTVERRDIRQIVRCVGEVEPALFTDLKAEVSGRIERLLVEEGDRVEKGDLLLELDRRELKTQIQEAQFKIEAARLRLEKAALDHDAKRGLREKDFVSEREFAEAEIDFKLSKNELEIQRSQLRLLEEKLTKTEVRAPHDGVILDHDLTEGMVITGVSSFNEGSVLMRVAQLSELEVETEISEVDVDKIHRNMPVQLIFDSLPDIELEGRIQFISPSAKPGAKNSTGSKARVFPIRIAFSAQKLRVRPGMTAQAILVVAEAERVLAATLPSVFNEEGENVVYVMEDQGFIRTPVEIGINDYDVVQISGGIREGQVLATIKPGPGRVLDPAALVASSD